jgi:hypothetical protein
MFVARCSAASWLACPGCILLLLLLQQLLLASLLKLLLLQLLLASLLQLLLLLSQMLAIPWGCGMMAMQ